MIGGFMVVLHTIWPVLGGNVFWVHSFAWRMELLDKVQNRQRKIIPVR